MDHSGYSVEDLESFHALPHEIVPDNTVYLDGEYVPLNARGLELTEEGHIELPLYEDRPGSSGLRTSARDLADFLIAHMNQGVGAQGARILEADLDDPASLGALSEANRADCSMPVGGIISLVGLDAAFRDTSLQQTEAPLRLAVWLLNLAKTFESQILDSVEDGGGLRPDSGAGADRPLRILHIGPTPFFSDRGCHIRIRGLVEAGYLVRTRADADTVEARFGLTEVRLGLIPATIGP